MALRSKAFLTFSLIAVATAAEPVATFQARQDRLFRDKTATVSVDDSGIAAAREGKSWRWTWDDIQQLTLLSDAFVIRTYDDVRWQGWRDREWEFEKVAPGTAEKLSPFLQQKLGSKLDAHLALAGSSPELWSVPAKLRERLGGPEGHLRVYDDRIVFHSPERNASRTWIIQQVATISSAGPFEFTIRTTANQDQQFTLKRPLPEQKYEQLWRQIEKRRSR